MEKHVFYDTVYGILIDDYLKKLIQKYYEKDFNLDEDDTMCGCSYCTKSENIFSNNKTEYGKTCHSTKEEFGINLFLVAEEGPWGYLGVELKSDQWFEYPKQMTYKQLQNRVREATENEADDFKKRLYHFKAMMNIPKDNKTLDNKCGYYKYWLIYNEN